MRIFVFILGIFAAVVCFEKPAAADGPWCVVYDGWGEEPRIAGFKHINNAWRLRPALVRRVDPILCTKACRGLLPLGARGTTPETSVDDVGCNPTRLIFGEHGWIGETQRNKNAKQGMRPRLKPKVAALTEA
jgi:hypothetical protein